LKGGSGPNTKNPETVFKGGPCPNTFLMSRPPSTGEQPSRTSSTGVNPSSRRSTGGLQDRIEPILRTRPLSAVGHSGCRPGTGVSPSSCQSTDDLQSRPADQGGHSRRRSNASEPLPVSTIADESGTEPPCEKVGTAEPTPTSPGVDDRDR
jgi:hypothetical protein